MSDNSVNNIQVRSTNRKRILNLLYRQAGLTKQDIAAELNLSLPTVSQILKELSEHGLVSKAGVGESSGGRKPVLNTLLYDAKCAAGIEITQNHIAFVLIDLAGNVQYYRRQRERFIAVEDYYKKLADYLNAFLSENHVERKKLLGVGLALPGILKGDSLLEYAPTLQIHELPLANFTKYLGEDIQMGNEAKLAGYAEVWGIEHLHDAVFLTVNKGVGGAILIHNNVYNGLNFRSGEFGHMTIVKDGRKCSCGRRGCFEAYCSTTRLLADEYDDVDSFFAMLAHGDEHCAAVWEEYLDNLATGINNIRMILDADIIIGGEIGQFIGRYLDRLKEKLRAKNSFNDHGDYIYESRFGGKASVIGAALLQVDQFLNF